MQFLDFLVLVILQIDTFNIQLHSAAEVTKQTQASCILFYYPTK